MYVPEVLFYLFNTVETTVSTGFLSLFNKAIFL